METWNIVYGIPLRDYLAAAALQGLIAGRWNHDETDERMARRAYAYADAMIKARETA